VRVALLTREWPPAVYGGAGVHVEQLAAQLRDRVDLDVHCFGTPRTDATAHPTWDALSEANPALAVLSTDLSMAAALRDTDVVHSHTWYTAMAGYLAKLTHGRPHVLTAHSLEPLRPWKADQLAGGYTVSCWAERTATENADAVIAVSAGMRDDILRVYPAVDPARVHVVHNGVDTDRYSPVDDPYLLVRHGIDPGAPIVLFVGRVTRQKGLPHLLAAARDFEPDAQLVLCAGAADTPELGAQVAADVASLQQSRAGVVWISDVLDVPSVIALMSAATVFVCPSIYEPLGIVNLEAMACGTAVVASAVGGIPEVVVDGETGLLVPYDESDAAAFEHGLTTAVNELLSNPDRARTMGVAGRARAVTNFGWPAIADATVQIYRSVREAAG
jgi:starch synthase